MLATVGRELEAQTLFRQFLETREAEDVWEPIEQTICAGGNFDPWQSEGIPKIFERLSFLYLSPLLKDKNCILLAPEETEYVYQQLYNKENLVKIYAFSPFFYSIPKPDGLIFIPGKKANLLTGVTEATICTHLESSKQKRMQVENFLCPKMMAKYLKIEPPIPYCFNPYALNYELGELVHSLRPNELPNLPVGLSRRWQAIFTIPEGVNCEFPVEKFPLPLNYYQFRDFATTWLAGKFEEIFPEGWAL